MLSGIEANNSVVRYQRSIVQWCICNNVSIPLAVFPYFRISGFCSREWYLPTTWQRLVVCNTTLRFFFFTEFLNVKNKWFVELRKTWAHMLAARNCWIIVSFIVWFSLSSRLHPPPFLPPSASCPSPQQLLRILLPSNAAKPKVTHFIQFICFSFSCGILCFELC